MPSRHDLISFKLTRESAAPVLTGKGKHNPGASGMFVDAFPRWDGERAFGGSGDPDRG